MDAFREVSEVMEVVEVYPGAQSFVHEGRVGVHVPHRGIWISAWHALARWDPPLVYLRPAPTNRHYYAHPGETEPRLCFQHGEWQPSYRLLTGIGCAVRFLNDYLAGGAR